MTLLSTTIRAVLTIAAVALCALPVASASEAEAESEETEARSVLSRGEFSPKFSLHGFADATFVAEELSIPNDDGEREIGFFLGEFDLYMVSQLSERFSFLGEVVFEFEKDGETNVDVERVFVKYTMSDLFWTSFGRRHTPLGYWNETFHHGLFLQPTVARPLVLRVEDNDGVLPIHSVGVDAGGRKFSGPWSLDYRGGVYNGRGATREVVQSFGDANVNKAALLKASLLLDRSDHIRVGGMVYSDEIPPNPDAPGIHEEMDERIYGLHFVYEREQLKVLTEYYHIGHREPATAGSWNHRGYYLIALWQPWKWKPYAGYDVLDLEEGDPYYAGIVPYHERILAGVRYDPIPFLAIKFEVRRDNRSESEANGVAIQAAYTF